MGAIANAANLCKQLIAHDTEARKAAADLREAISNDPLAEVAMNALKELYREVGSTASRRFANADEAFSALQELEIKSPGSQDSDLEIIRQSVLFINNGQDHSNIEALIQRVNPVTAIRFLNSIAKHTNVQVRLVVCKALSKMPINNGAEAILTRMMTNSDERVRDAAALSLQQLA